jgi:hypothetical protein
VRAALLALSLQGAVSGTAVPDASPGIPLPGDRRAIEALGPRQARTASVLQLLDVILRMLHGERMAGTRPASRSDDESRRVTAHGAGQGFGFRR